MLGISKYNIIYDIDKTNIIVYNTISGAIITLPKIFYKTVLKTDVNILQNHNPSIFNLLIKYKIISDDDIERNKIIDEISNIQNNMHTLSLLLHSTLRCNLNCAYCFQKGVRQSTMSAKTASKIVDLIQYQYLKNNLDIINIVWSGGEPLLNISAIEYIYNELIKQLPDDVLNVSIYTNGTLLSRPNMRRLYCAGIRHIQVTIDGTDEIHNTRRGDSLKTILNNIDNILTDYSDVRITARSNIDKSNIENYIKLYVSLMDKYKNSNFTLYPEFVIGDSAINSNIILPEEQTEIILLLASYGVYNVDLLFNRCRQLCMKKANNSIAICPDGYLYDCELLVGKDSGIIGAIDQYLESSLPSKEFQLKDMCKDCILLPICNLGCTAKTNKTTLCHIMKNREPDFLRLYYLQNYNSINKNVVP